MRLVLSRGPLDQCHIAVIGVLQVAAETHEVIKYVAAVVLDRIVQRSLAILIAVVVFAAMLHEELTHFQVPLADSIINRILSVSVDVVWTESLIHQEFSDLKPTISACIV